MLDKPWEMEPYDLTLYFSGLINPDINIGGEIPTKEVLDGKTSTDHFQWNSCDRLPIVPWILEKDRIQAVDLEASALWIGK